MALGWVGVLPVPVVARPPVALGIGLPTPSLAVTVIVEASLAAATGDVAVTGACPAETAAGLTTTAAVCVTATALIVAETVFDSATVELNVPVATPLAFVAAVGWVSVFPVPVAASTTVAPAIGFPEPSLAVTVIVDVVAPHETAGGAPAA